LLNIEQSKTPTPKICQKPKFRWPWFQTGVEEKIFETSNKEVDLAPYQLCVCVMYHCVSGGEQGKGAKRARWETQPDEVAVHHEAI